MEKANEALWDEVAEPFAGPEVIVIAGGVVSTVKGRPLTALTLPVGSIASIEILCGLSERCGVV